jgi:hypothetical protein
MGITLGKLQKRLLGELDVIPSSMSRTLVNDALREIYDSNDWGFLFTEGYIRTPAMIQGTANVAEFGLTITLDGATNALLLAATSNINQVQANERQIRLLSPKQQDRGFVYNIVSYDSGAGAITLDIPWQDIDNTAALIQIVKMYYSPPMVNIGTSDSPNMVVDFKRFESIISPTFNRRINLNVSLNELNTFDPTRYSSGDPYALVPFSSKYGVRMFELYPTPKFERILRIKYMRNGLPLVKDSDQAPDIFTEELIISRAKIKSYEWAYANSDKVSIKGPSKFQNLIALANSPNSTNSYTNLLARAIKKDEELYPKAYLGSFAEVPEYDDIFSDNRGMYPAETLILNF